MKMSPWFSNLLSTAANDKYSNFIYWPEVSYFFKSVKKMLLQMLTSYNSKNSQTKETVFQTESIETGFYVCTGSIDSVNNISCPRELSADPSVNHCWDWNSLWNALVVCLRRKKKGTAEAGPVMFFFFTSLLLSSSLLWSHFWVWDGWRDFSVKSEASYFEYTQSCG